MASTIFESYLHCLEWNWNVLFCSLGRSTLLVVTVAPVRSFLPILLIHYCFLKLKLFQSIDEYREWGIIFTVKIGIYDYKPFFGV